MKNYVPVIYEHLFSGMHQILHLKLDNIIQGTNSGITHVKIKDKKSSWSNARRTGKENVSFLKGISLSGKIGF